VASDLKIVRTDSLTDIAFKVCTALDQEGVKAVLCGGSAAEVYVPQEYQSGDVDFIVSWPVDDKRLERIVGELGYRRQGSVYVCDDNRVTLDFPSDVLMIWDEAVTRFDTLTRDGMLLHVQTPFDTVRDRLCWYFSDVRDFQSLGVAVAVAKACDVGVDKVAEWAASIGESARFEDFKRALSADR
jgi:hypothetical protein